VLPTRPMATDRPSTVELRRSTALRASGGLPYHGRRIATPAHSRARLRGRASGVRESARLRTAAAVTESSGMATASLIQAFSPLSFPQASPPASPPARTDVPEPSRTSEPAA
jgi:hypothetical protein